MTEIKKLEFDTDVEGAENSGGQSCNFWGRIQFPEELLAHINKHRKTEFLEWDSKAQCTIVLKNQKSPVWTAHDQTIYANEPETITTNDLPPISATFKSCFRPYSAVAENMGMKIALALGQPTSYNYLVSFNPEEYPEIVKNYPSVEKLSKLQPYGIVSIDFLQAQHGLEKWTKADHKTFQGETEIDSVDNLAKDELLSMEDVYQHLGIRFADSEEGNYIENWIDVVDEFARDVLKGQPRERVNKTIDKMHSRIARSFLLREFLGDCDFTARNTGLVYNDELGQLNYAPNHDFGEALNPVIENLFTKKDKYFGMSEEVFNSLPEPIREKLISQKPKEKTVEEVAIQPASASSEQNLKYVIDNFPEACKEFFENLDYMISTGEIDKIVDSYAGLTCNGKELLTQEERITIKEFLEIRANYMCERYVEAMQDLGYENPFIDFAGEDDFEM